MFSQGWPRAVEFAAAKGETDRALPHLKHGVRQLFVKTEKKHQLLIQGNVPSSSESSQHKRFNIKKEEGKELFFLTQVITLHKFYITNT